VELSKADKSVEPKKNLGISKIIKRKVDLERVSLRDELDTPGRAEGGGGMGTDFLRPNRRVLSGRWGWWNGVKLPKE